MTPFEINLLLHIYTSPSPPENIELTLTQQTLLSFMKNGLIVEVDDDLYEATDRGIAHVSQLCNLAWPIPAWVDENGSVIQV